MFSIQHRGTTPPFGLVFTMADFKPHIANGYFFTPCVANWRFEGSNDKIDWTVLDEVKNFKGSKRPKITRFFKNDKPYTYYRLVWERSRLYINIGEFDILYNRNIK